MLVLTLSDGLSYLCVGVSDGSMAMLGRAGGFLIASLILFINRIKFDKPVLELFVFNCDYVSFKLLVS